VGISIFRVCLDSRDLILSFMVAMGNKQKEDLIDGGGDERGFLFLTQCLNKKKNQFTAFVGNSYGDKLTEDGKY
jgi:hypothetical protein